MGGVYAEIVLGLIGGVQRRQLSEEGSCRFFWTKDHVLHGYLYMKNDLQIRQTVLRTVFIEGKS